jgi:mono/diheme cytochrome c family protein
MRPSCVFKIWHFTNSLAATGVLALVGIHTISIHDAFADDLAKGKELYSGVGACFSCHGVTGHGDGPAAAALNPKPRSFVDDKFVLDTDKDGKTGTAIDIYNIITDGAAKYGGSPMMVGRMDIPEADRKAIAAYVVSLEPKK